MIFLLLSSAFLMGLLGSPHCLGMCGGLVTAFGLSMQNSTPNQKKILIASYHIGRLMSYTLLGIIASLIGTGIFANISNTHWPRLFLGIILILIGFAMLGLPLLNALEKLGMQLWQKLAPLRQKIFPLNTMPRALMAGILWGFLPCGLVYAALLMAVVGHNLTTGALLMFAFGLGTLPMLLATQTIIDLFYQKIGKIKLRQLSGTMMILSGMIIATSPIIMHHLHGEHHHHQHSQEQNQNTDNSIHSTHHNQHQHH